MTFPAVIAALGDARLQRRDLHVYRLALAELDLADWKEFKRAFVARRCHMRGEHVSHALKRLCVSGYLERESTPPNNPNPRRYRLRYSPFPQVGVRDRAPPEAA